VFVYPAWIPMNVLLLPLVFAKPAFEPNVVFPPAVLFINAESPTPTLAVPVELV